MRKQEFLTALRTRLSVLPIADAEERLLFYSENIDDRMEDGLTEEDAVVAIGSTDEIVEQILVEIPLSRLVKEKIRPKRRLQGWEILLLAIGAPIWLSLAVSALAVILSLYATLWAGIVSLWAVFASLAACAFSGLAVGIGLAVGGYTFTGLTLLSAALVCTGLSILCFFACGGATKGTAILAKKLVLGMKFAFIGKENKK